MIVIDVEIEKAILGRGEEPIEGIEYCKGWRDFAGMGIAVVCAYHMTTQLSRCFFKRDLLALQQYVDGQPTAGFNTRRFDLPLLAHHGVTVDQAQHFDVLEQIWLALGLDPDRYDHRTHGGWSLDNIMKATFGLSKSGHGALAPVFWQQGKIGEVVDYCLRDVWLEQNLVQHARLGLALFKEPDGEPVIIERKAA